MASTTREDALKSGDYDALQIHESMFFAVVCHRVGMDSQSAISRATMPAGTSGGWRFVERNRLPDSWWEGEGATLAAERIGESDPHKAPYPQPCSEHPDTHVHVVAEC
jgi:hypothetical protein